MEVDWSRIDAGVMLIVVLSVAAVAGVVSGIVHRSLHRQVLKLNNTVSQLEQAMHSTATLLAENAAQMQVLQEQGRQLSRRQDLLDAAAAKSGFNQAIALSRHGANLSELMQTCGVSQGEARLIQTLYGVASPMHGEDQPGHRHSHRTASQ